MNDVLQWAHQQDPAELKRQLIEAYNANSVNGSGELYDAIIQRFRTDTGLGPNSVSNFGVILSLGGWLMTVHGEIAL